MGGQVGPARHLKEGLFHRLADRPVRLARDKLFERGLRPTVAALPFPARQVPEPSASAI
jgi:hypothetical protein